jgi:hypothetical protein
MQRLTEAEVQSLAERLFSRSVSKRLNDQPAMQPDMGQASRVLRALLAAYELVTGRQLTSVIVAGEGC